MESKEKRKKFSKEQGITLIVLVVTIIVLLILAGVTLNALFNENGILEKAQNSGNKMNEAKESDLDAINKLNEWVDSATGNPTKPEQPVEKISITDESLKSNDRVTTNSKTVIAKDKKENQVVVPGGFKISTDSGETVQQGIVIEDKDKNQFVWVPVSNVDGIKAGEAGSTSTPIVKDDGTEVEITLGRYTFANSSDTIPGEPTIVQKGSEYAAVTAANVADGTVDEKYKIDENFYELSDKNRKSNENGDETGNNTTAKNLQAFVTTTQKNKGYYIARYEASYGSGYNADGQTTEEKYGEAKPLSIASESYTQSNFEYKKGMLWNHISQPQAAIVCKNMYNGSDSVESDLTNSYAWDTAIVYIQLMTDTDYANEDRGTNKALANTGSTSDEKCKIFDMAANEYEWTTEYYANTAEELESGGGSTPCTRRGGYYGRSGVNFTTKRRIANTASGASASQINSFRPILYLKEK